MIINQTRTYYDKYTQSELYINGGRRFCWVLEDKRQPGGVKIDGETCIPEGTYGVTITRSNRWGKDMLLLYNTQVDLSINRNGVRFTGVRPHGGNDVDDTHGCPLCAYNTDHNGKIWKRASGDLFDLVRSEDEPVLWVVSSF